MTVEVRPAGPDDVPALAAIHRRAFPSDPLARLGRRFLERAFYPAAVVHPLARCFLASLDGRPIGFHLCALDHTRFHERIFPATRWSLAAALASRPRLWAFAARHAIDRLAARDSPPWAGEPEVFLVAVDPEARRLAPIGARRLIHAGWDWLRAEGRTTCVAHIEEGYEPGLRIARGCGMRDVGSERRGGRTFVVLRKML